MLPELKFRPSLSEPAVPVGDGPDGRVLPELKFRPSLSDAGVGQLFTVDAGVAGTKVPALIER